MTEPAPIPVDPDLAALERALADAGGFRGLCNRVADEWERTAPERAAHYARCRADTDAFVKREMARIWAVEEQS